MNVQTRWERIYAEKSPDTVSWYRPHLETSLELIERAAPARSAAIIDVGGGESTLVDDLLARGYHNVTVLDVSRTAIDVTKRRLGAASEGVKWLVADIGKAELGPRAYDVWHDRAVFHFLTAVGERTVYVRQVARAVKPRGHVIVSTFGPDKTNTERTTMRGAFGYLRVSGPGQAADDRDGFPRQKDKIRQWDEGEWRPHHAVVQRRTPRQDAVRRSTWNASHVSGSLLGRH